MSQLAELVATYRAVAKALRTIEHDHDSTAYPLERARLQQAMDGTLERVRGYDSLYAESLAVGLVEEHRMVQELNKPYTPPPGVPLYQAREQHDLWVASRNRHLEIVRDDITRALRHDKP